MSTAKIFIDCEFTGFVEPQLLSIGLVQDQRNDFYGELTPPLEREDNPFVDEHVLTQWGKTPALFNGLSILGSALSLWFFRLQAHTIEVHYDYHTDMDLLEHALTEAGIWDIWKHRLVPVHVGYLYNDKRVELFMQGCWAREEESTGLKAHHALADARVLRSTFLMVHPE